jgi:hypothetical protein
LTDFLFLIHCISGWRKCDQEIFRMKIFRASMRISRHVRRFRFPHFLPKGFRRNFKFSTRAFATNVLLGVALHLVFIW